MPTRNVLHEVESIRASGIRLGWQDLIPVVAATDSALYERLRHLLGELVPVGHHAEACLLLAEGLALAAKGTGSQAISNLSAAADAFQAVGDPYHEAKACEALSAVATSHGIARSAANRAATLYSEIGAVRSLSRLVRLSRRRGLLTHLPIPAAHRGKGAPGLTKREQQVAEIAGRGYTIEEIARELVISPRTVEKHLERVRAKLGIRRKNELVRLMHE
jgi:DNA-binding CsgD family transcriptional regulator